MIDSFKKHLKELSEQVTVIGGVLEWYIVDNERVSLDLYLQRPLKDIECVASIDWQPDERYFGRRTFNVTLYNENFGISEKERKKTYQLQKLATKYSNLFWKDENLHLLWKDEN